MFHIIGSSIRSATINRTHCCVSMAMLSLLRTLLTVIYVHQQYKGEAMLRFHGNSDTRTRNNIKLEVHCLSCLLYCSRSLCMFTDHE
jgi:hypothetical protein